MSFFEELKRRQVFKVGIAYVVMAWLILQVADVILNNVAAPGWVFDVLLSRVRVEGSAGPMRCCWGRGVRRWW